MYKDNAVGNVVAETGREFGTTLRHDWAIFQCRWQAKFDAHLNRLQGHRRQPIVRCGKFVRHASSRRALDCACFLPSCTMYKDNAVGNVVAETGRDLVFMITARLSDLSMPLKGEVRRSPEQSARQPIARSSKFVRQAYLRRALGCEKTTV